MRKGRGAVFATVTGIGALAGALGAAEQGIEGLLDMHRASVWAERADEIKSLDDPLIVESADKPRYDSYKQLRDQDRERASDSFEVVGMAVPVDALLVGATLAGRALSRRDSQTPA